MQTRLPGTHLMGLRQTISEWVKIIRDALDFGPEFPAAMEARHVLFAQESARLQHLLEQTRKASQEKDELIAKLRAAGAVTGNMVVDGPAFYIKKANSLDGPFCTSCFQRSHEVTRIAPAPKPKGADGTSADWVQCGKCKTPFRSDRIGHYLNPVRVPSGKGTGADDRQRKTEDRGQKTEDREQRTEDSAVLRDPSSVVRHPPSNSEPAPNPPQSRTDTMGSGSVPPVQKSALGKGSPCGTAATPNAKECVWEPDALGCGMQRITPEGGRATRLEAPSPSPDAMPRSENPKPASAQVAVLPQQDDPPKPVKTTRKPRRDPEHDASRVGRAPTGETGPAPTRTQPRTRKPKRERPEPTKTTGRSKPTE